MSAIELKRVTKKYGSVMALDDVSLNIEGGKITVLLGPSGCGKTTCLRCIVGLEKPDAGEIFVGGEPVVTSKAFVPPEKRGMGMVFQSYAIWPHMTVFNNVAFPLKVKKFSKKEIAEKVGKALKLVDLEGLEERYATQISGGQQQRVALARSLVYDPNVLLLDEPLSNLDAKLREKMRFDLKELQSKLKITMIHVTHDQAEAMVIADKIVVMDKGKIVEIGTAEELYNNPSSSFVAGFIGLTNFVRGTFLGNQNGFGLSQAEGGALIEVPLNEDIEPKTNVLVSIRPEDVMISSKKPPAKGNFYKCKIVTKTFLGDIIDYTIDVDGIGEMRVHEKPADHQGGEDLFVYLEREKCKVIREKNGRKS